MKKKMNFYARIKLQKRQVYTWTWREMTQFVMDIATYDDWQQSELKDKIRLIKSILASKRITSLKGLQNESAL